MVYRLTFEPLLSLSKPDDLFILRTWKNPQPIGEWYPLSFKTEATDLPDVVGFRNVMVWHPDLVKAIPADDYQALPIELKGRLYYAIHITQVCDCLDPTQSQLKRFKNRVIGVDHYVINPQKVGDVSLFVIPDDGYSAIFSTARFKAMVEEQGWTGLTFTTVDFNSGA